MCIIKKYIDKFFRFSNTRESNILFNSLLNSDLSNSIITDDNSTISDCNRNLLFINDQCQNNKVLKKELPKE